MGNLEIKQQWLDMGFSQFPKLIDRMTEINGNDKIILKVIFARIMEKGDGNCFPGNKLIAWDAGVEIRTVQRALKKWEELGFLKVVIEKDKRHFIFKKIPQKFIIKYQKKNDYEEVGTQIEAQKDEPIEVEIIPEQNNEEKAMEMMEPHNKKELAMAAMQYAQAKAEDVREANLKKHREKISSRIFEKPKKVKVTNSDTARIIKVYEGYFNQTFNSHTIDHTKWIPCRFTQKELGQIKQFNATYSVDIFEGLINEVCTRWAHYKRLWKVDVELPTIGILVGFGKSQALAMTKEMVDNVPEKENGEVSKIKKVGW